MEYGLVGLLILIADVYAIMHTINGGRSPLEKLLWVLGILIFPVLGFIIWLIAGPKNYSGSRSPYR